MGLPLPLSCKFMPFCSSFCTNFTTSLGLNMGGESGPLCSPCIYSYDMDLPEVWELAIASFMFDNMGEMASIPIAECA